MRKATIELPIPPTLNKMYPDGKGKRGLSEEYRNWRDEAGWILKAQLLSPFPGKVHLDMTICGGKGFPISSDLSNRWKAVEDLLVTHGILNDDNVQFVVGHCDRYEPPTEKCAKARCILTIESAEEGETDRE